MTKQKLTEAVIALEAESKARREGGELVFDGGDAWDALINSLAECAIAEAERLKAAGDVGGPALLDHFGYEP